jgi:uncharacterized protein (UPF0335 family)
VAQNTELAADLRTLLSAIERLEGKRNTAQREREDAFDHINGWKERALAAEARAKAAEDDAAAWKADAASQFLARKSAEGALRQIADAPTPPHQNGHYLQARNAVNISRAHFTKHSKGGET